MSKYKIALEKTLPHLVLMIILLFITPFVLDVVVKANVSWATVELFITLLLFNLLPMALAVFFGYVYSKKAILLYFTLGLLPALSLLVYAGISMMLKVPEAEWGVLFGLILLGPGIVLGIANYLYRKFVVKDL